MTQVLDHGSIELIDSMGGDLSIVNAARTSFDSRSLLHYKWCPAVSGDESCKCPIQARDGVVVSPVDASHLAKRDAGLINFLMKHRHGTPFEMVEFMFQVEAPIFVLREWHRHRIASINEMSGRYVELERKFYVPHRDDIREQVGKAGSYTYERVENDSLAELTRLDITDASNSAFDAYEAMLKRGIAREVARLVLPVNVFSKMVWSVNGRALLNFLSLRNAPNAQLEIRRYAEAMEDIAKQLIPVTMKAFEENGRVCP